MSNRLQYIRNFRSINEQLAIGGQPEGGEFEAVKEAGFEVAINLARPDSPHAVADEPDRWSRLGVDYIHIPVDFKHPTLDEFERFCAAMDQNRERRIFVHCALNWRVSSFVCLYRILRGQADADQALAELHSVWEPDEVWQHFIDQVLRESGQAPSGKT